MHHWGLFQAVRTFIKISVLAIVGQIVEQYRFDISHWSHTVFHLLLLKTYMDDISELDINLDIIIWN